MTASALRPTPSSEPSAVAPRLPLRTWFAMYTRLHAVQGSWNYELLVGPGIGFAAEPALRKLPGAEPGQPYRDALARQSRYFNAHPYLTALAVGALARAELDRVPPEKIERFRTALCGPLGSVGDRLVWAGWLPCCSALALLAYGLGASAAMVVLLFLVIYNLGHLGLRAWGLSEGWKHGMRVAVALGSPVLRHGPPHLARVTALVGGLALPLAVERVLGPDLAVPARGDGIFAWSALPYAVAVVVAVLGAALISRLHGSVPGWRIALAALAALSLYSTLRW